MSLRPNFPMWLYLGIAMTIAAMGFAIGQLAPGAGVPVVLAASGLWTAYAVKRQGQRRRNDG